MKVFIWRIRYAMHFIRFSWRACGLWLAVIRGFEFAWAVNAEYMDEEPLDVLRDDIGAMI